MRYFDVTVKTEESYKQTFAIIEKASDKTTLNSIVLFFGSLAIFPSAELLFLLIQIICYIEVIYKQVKLGSC